jgi:UPF0176 protein
MKARNIAFYKFIALEKPEELRETLLKWARMLALKGTVLMATEGINGMLSGKDSAVQDFESKIRSDQRFSDLLFKVSFSETVPFKKLLIKVKPEVLTLGLDFIQPHKERAPYVTPEELCAGLAHNENIKLIDIRNNFEVEHGSFKGAINPKTKSFSEFPKFAENLDLPKDQKIVTFCTGGIRCEKGALILKKAGFTNVFQLEGGILEYFSKTKGGPFFEGNCFVFDERELLTPELKARKIGF